MWISRTQTTQLVLKLQWTLHYRPSIIHTEVLNREGTSVVSVLECGY